MPNTNTMVALPEILGAMSAHNEQLIHDATAKMDTEILTVANSATEVHLTLPYYSDLDKTLEVLDDEKLGQASGGNMSVGDYAKITRAQQYIYANIDTAALAEQGVTGFSFDVDAVNSAIDSGSPVPVSFTTAKPKASPAASSGGGGGGK